MTNFVATAVKAGYPYALVLDFLDALGHGVWQEITEPTLDWLAEYKADQESAYNAQVAWDASQVRRDPINVGGYQRGKRGIWGV